MEVRFSPKSEGDLDKIDNSLRKLFVKHAEKLTDYPANRHMKFGIPFNVEEVTKQARIVFEIRENYIYILHCFKDHKEYETWYKSYK